MPFRSSPKMFLACECRERAVEVKEGGERHHVFVVVRTRARDVEQGLEKVQPNFCGRSYPASYVRVVGDSVASEHLANIAERARGA